MSPWAANRGDAVCEMNLAERLAMFLVRVAVRFDEAGHHAAAGRVDDVTLRMQISAMRLDGSDAITLDDDIHIGPGGGLRAIDETAGVHDETPAWHPWRPRQI